MNIVKMKPCFSFSLLRSKYSMFLSMSLPWRDQFKGFLKDINWRPWFAHGIFKDGSWEHYVHVKQVLSIKPDGMNGSNYQFYSHMYASCYELPSYIGNMVLPDLHSVHKGLLLLDIEFTSFVIFISTNLY